MQHLYGSRGLRLHRVRDDTVPSDGRRPPACAAVLADHASQCLWSFESLATFTRLPLSVRYRVSMLRNVNRQVSMRFINKASVFPDRISHNTCIMESSVVSALDMMMYKLRGGTVDRRSARKSNGTRGRRKCGRQIRHVRYESGIRHSPRKQFR